MTLEIPGFRNKPRARALRNILQRLKTSPPGLSLFPRATEITRLNNYSNSKFDCVTFQTHHDTFELWDFYFVACDRDKYRSTYRKIHPFVVIHVSVDNSLSFVCARARVLHQLYLFTAIASRHRLIILARIQSSIRECVQEPHSFFFFFRRT